MEHRQDPANNLLANIKQHGMGRYINNYCHYKKKKHIDALLYARLYYSKSQSQRPYRKKKQGEES